jgi:hypothetical protein
MLGSPIKPAAHSCARLKEALQQIFKVFIMTSSFIFLNSQAGQGPVNFAATLAAQAPFDFLSVNCRNSSWELV